MNCVNNDNNEINLKRQLIEVTDAVRKKFKSVKNRHMENKLALEKIYEPVTQPLKAISAAAQVKSHTIPQITSPSKPSLATPARGTQLAASSRKSSVFSKSLPGGYGDDSDDEYNIQQTSFMETPPSSLAPSIRMTPPNADVPPIGDNEQISDVVSAHIEKLKAEHPSYDRVYGVRVDPNTKKLLMGGVEIRFSSQNIELWDGKKKMAAYKSSPALLDMLFLKFPPSLRTDGVIDELDGKTYAEILKKTKSPYKNYDIKKGYNVTKWRKYREIIKPLTAYNVTTRSQSGMGITPKIPTMKLYNRNVMHYVYWNKPKELVDRLRLLWSSKMAGHTGHDNEIMNIIEELREEGIIW